MSRKRIAGAAAGPPDRWQILPAPQRAPEWWVQLYAKRQAVLHAEVRRLVRRGSRPLALAEIQLGLPRYHDGEVEDAVRWLIADGSVQTVDRPGFFNGVATPRYRLAVDGDR